MNFLSLVGCSLISIFSSFTPSNRSINSTRNSIAYNNGVYTNYITDDFRRYVSQDTGYFNILYRAYDEMGRQSQYYQRTQYYNATTPSSNGALYDFLENSDFNLNPIQFVNGSMSFNSNIVLGVVDCYRYVAMSNSDYLITDLLRFYYYGNQLENKVINLVDTFADSQYISFDSWSRFNLSNGVITTDTNLSINDTLSYLSKVDGSERVSFLQDVYYFNQANSLRGSFLPVVMYWNNLLVESSNNTYNSIFQLTSYDMNDVNYQNIYTQGYNDGYNQGNTSGYSNGSQDGYNTGYQDGHTAGITESNQYNFTTLFGAIADTPVLIVRNLFDFDFFGINLLTVVLSLFTGLILFYLLRKLL